MSKKILAVFGATGQQGGSVVDFLLNDVELSSQYTLRAITRDASSQSALQLKQKNVEVVQADATKPSTLNDALTGAHTVFAMTASVSGPEPKEREFAAGKAIADAAVAKGVQYLIFSTLPHVTKLSGGRYTKVASFDAKAEVEEYIRTLPVKSAFFAPGSFMQNVQSGMGAAHQTETGDFVVARHTSPSARLPLVDIVGDTGKFVGAILAEPDRYEGQTFCAATKLYSMQDMSRIMGDKAGKTVRYEQIPQEQFRGLLGAHMGDYADALIEMMLFQQDFGYYGPETEALVQWAADHARGEVTTFDKYLEEHPMPSLQ